MRPRRRATSPASAPSFASGPDEARARVAPLFDALGQRTIWVGPVGARSRLDRIAQGEYSAQFALSLALKDVHLALEVAGHDRFAALACLAGEWQQAVDQGLGDQDLTVVTRALAQ